MVGNREDTIPIMIGERIDMFQRYCEIAYNPNIKVHRKARNVWHDRRF